MNKKPTNKAIHFEDGVTVLAIGYKGDILPCYLDTADYQEYWLL